MSTFMTYEDFLFSQLFMNYVENNNTTYKDLEYDLIFHEVLYHKDMFNKSDYISNVEKSYYDCILDYLNDNIKNNNNE